MHEELKALLGGISPDEDVRANAAHKARVLTAPLSAAELALHDSYLAEVRRRSDTNPTSLDNRQRRAALAMVALDNHRESLLFLRDQIATFESVDNPPNPHLSDLARERVDAALSRFREDAERMEFGIAAALFALGDFEDALAALPESAPSEVRAMYAEFDAAEKGTDESCECPKRVAVQTPVQRAAGVVMLPIEENTEFVQGDFPNRRRGSWVWAIRCVTCHRLTIRTTLTSTAAHEMRVTQTTDDVATALAPRTVE